MSRTGNLWDAVIERSLDGAALDQAGDDVRRVKFNAFPQVVDDEGPQNDSSETISAQSQSARRGLNSSGTSQVWNLSYLEPSINILFPNQTDFRVSSSFKSPHEHHPRVEQGGKPLTWA